MREHTHGSGIEQQIKVPGDLPEGQKLHTSRRVCFPQMGGEGGQLRLFRIPHPNGQLRPRRGSLRRHHSPGTAAQQQHPASQGKVPDSVEKAGAVRVVSGQGAVRLPANAVDSVVSGGGWIQPIQQGNDPLLIRYGHVPAQVAGHILYLLLHGFRGKIQQPVGGILPTKGKQRLVQEGGHGMPQGMPDQSVCFRHVTVSSSESGSVTVCMSTSFRVCFTKEVSTFLGPSSM